MEFRVFICNSPEQDNQVMHDADSAYHQPIQKEGDLSMNTGIIMIGMALVLLSAGLLSSPASATVQENACGQSCCYGIDPHAFQAGFHNQNASVMIGVTCSGTVTDKPDLVP